MNELTRRGPADPSSGAREALRWLARGAWLAVIPLLAGLLGALAATIAEGVLRLTAGVPTLPELFGDRIIMFMSADQFVSFLLRFSPNSKTTPLLLALLGQITVGVLLGPLYALVTRLPLRVHGGWPTRREWLVAGSIALVLEVLTQVVFWPLLFANLVGDPVERARLFDAVGTLFVYAIFVIVIALVNRWLRVVWGAWLAARGGMLGTATTAPEGTLAPAPDLTGEEGEHTVLRQPVSRRAALGAAGAVVVALGVGSVALRDLVGAYLARSNLAYEGMETSYEVSQATQLTPNAEFYIVSQNVLDPVVDASRWQFVVGGLVRQVRTWTLDQVMALPSETRAITLECVSNPPGGRLMSTAEWRGVSLAQVIAEAGGADSAAKYVIFSSVDGYQSSLPLSDLLQARTLLAYCMNGTTLPQRHGYPLRAVVPGRYGEQSPKWLTRIDLSDQPFKGLYQDQGWSDRQLFTTSRIERPGRWARLRLGAIPVSGLAFAGIRGIQRVEVSADNGASWNTATLIPPLSDQTWVYWRWLWTPTMPGAYTLVVRATDGTGATQTAVTTSTVPNGATGQHHVPVTVMA